MNRSKTRVKKQGKATPGDKKENNKNNEDGMHAESGGKDDYKDLTEEEAREAKKKEGLATKRPIIFICNDPYAKGLKELRQKAIVFHFKKPDTNKLLKRLSTICKKEVGYYRTSDSFTRTV